MLKDMPFIYIYIYRERERERERERCLNSPRRFLSLFTVVVVSVFLSLTLVLSVQEKMTESKSLFSSISGVATYGLKHL